MKKLLEAIAAKDALGQKEESLPIAILQGLYPLPQDLACCALTTGAMVMKQKMTSTLIDSRSH